MLLLTPLLAVAQEEWGDEEPVEERRPFEQGDLEAAIVLGFAGGDGYQYAAGGAVAYYVLPGVAPGLDVTVRGGSEIPTQTWTLLPLKWVLYRSYKFAPYVIGEGGRIFIHDEAFPDLWLAGGGPGFHLFFSRRVGFKVQGIYYRLFPERDCADLAGGCDGIQIGLGLSFVL